MSGFTEEVLADPIVSQIVDIHEHSTRMINIIAVLSRLLELEQAAAEIGTPLAAELLYQLRATLYDGAMTQLRQSPVYSLVAQLRQRLDEASATTHAPSDVSDG